jgi:hypothetical protein
VEKNIFIQSNKNIVWKKILGFPSYKVSNTGIVKNYLTGNILKGKSKTSGYFTVSIRNKNNKNKTVFIHRLVAITLIPNPNNLPIVDHIDNNKENNHVNNLRWSTYKNNSNYYIKNFKKIKYRAILQYDFNNNLIKKWNSMKEILENNPTYVRHRVHDCLRHRSKNNYGFVWKYEPPLETEFFDKNEKFVSIGIYKSMDLSDYKISKNGNIIGKRGRLLKNIKNHNGYLIVCLRSKTKQKNIVVHRLVAHIFVKNDDPLNKTVINHIDENRANPYYKNLEWTTLKNNTIYSCGKPVKMIDATTNEILMIFKSLSYAAKYVNVNYSSIRAVCIGKRAICHGYKWEFVKN